MEGTYTLVRVPPTQKVNDAFDSSTNLDNYTRATFELRKRFKPRTNNTDSSKKDALSPSNQATGTKDSTQSNPTPEQTTSEDNPS
jgi:uncharacterized protein YciW